jgi:peptidoglycan/LPS O-acetylase OafA/YrhL
MNWASTASFDQIWRSPTFPMWTLAAAGIFGIILLITLLRAEKSIANGALTVITLLAIGVAVAAIRTFAPGDRVVSGETRSLQQTTAALPALSCIDDLAGETVLAACEKAVFGSAESVAAAVSYAASQVTRLTMFGDAAAANKNLTYELLTLRRAI